jgi:hypothetical protein
MASLDSEHLGDSNIAFLAHNRLASSTPVCFLNKSSARITKLDPSVGTSCTLHVNKSDGASVGLNDRVSPKSITWNRDAKS